MSGLRRLSDQPADTLRYWRVSRNAELDGVLLEVFSKNVEPQHGSLLLRYSRPTAALAASHSP